MWCRRGAAAGGVSRGRLLLLRAPAGIARALLWALLLVLSPTLARAAPNVFLLEPQLFDIDEHSVSVELAGSEQVGSLWSYITEPEVVLSSDDIKAGTGQLAGSPVTCGKFGVPITDSIFSYSLSDCSMDRGGTYAFHAYIESTDGGTMYNETFEVQPDPEPLPAGPFCYDIDRQYVGAEVNETIAEVEGAEECQQLCAESEVCQHFRYVHSPSRADFRTCTLLSSGPPSGVSSPEDGLTTGPKTCDWRSVNTLRLTGTAVGSSPSLPVRDVPFTLLVEGINFDDNYDRVMLVPVEQPCGIPFGNYSVGNNSVPFSIRGSSPGTFEDWAALLCNGTQFTSDVSRLVCGLPPETVLFDEVGDSKACLCDAGKTPYGCDRTEFFEFTLVSGILRIAGPYPDQVKQCPAGNPCTIEGVEGYLIRPGDRMMVRESCSLIGRPTVTAYTDSSSDFSVRGSFIWSVPNTASCSPDHETGPCLVARMCYCAGSSVMDYPCSDDSDFVTDAGEMQFFGVPSAPELPVILQEDFESFTIRWNYPDFDGGQHVDNYTLYFRLCPGAGQAGESTVIMIPSEPGDNERGLARNATYQFRSVPFGVGFRIFVDVLPATRYCVAVSASSIAGEGQRSPELVWVTDVRPPRIVDYAAAAAPPVSLERGVPMDAIEPTIETQDCTPLASVLNGHILASDCEVQLFEVFPSLPLGLSLDPATGRISGTPEVAQPRPEVWRVTATNAGGKSSFHISLAVRGRMSDFEVSLRMSMNDAVLTFRTPVEEDGQNFYARYSAHPQTLRLRGLSSQTTALYQSSAEDLGVVAREGSIPCGAFVIDAWSSSPSGFPPPAMCHWDASQGQGAVVDLDFQGGATFEADTWYQLVLRMRVAIEMPKDTPVLGLELFMSEASSDEDSPESESFGEWTPIRTLPSWRRELSLEWKTPLRTPLMNAPWTNGQPMYVSGFLNPLFGEVPAGQPFPDGFPAPGPTECLQGTSLCPTALHTFENAPEDTAWYTDTNPDFGMFPGFIVASGEVLLQTPVLRQMTFNPFGNLEVHAVPRPPVALGSEQPVYVPRQEFVVAFVLFPDPTGRYGHQRHITVCPTSPLQMPLMAESPGCEISDGPDFVECSCSSTLPLDHPSGAARCDLVRLAVTIPIDMRMEIAATLRIRAGDTASFAGFWPIRWSAEVRSETGGLYSFKKTENAALDIAPDHLLEDTTPAACAELCLEQFDGSGGLNFACRSFRYHKVEEDCYLSRYTEDDPGVVLVTDWPGNVFDSYEYQDQVVYAVTTPDKLFFPGVFIAETSLMRVSSWDPPEAPAAPYFSLGEGTEAEPRPAPLCLLPDRFLPSCADGRYVVYRVELVPAVPIHGEDPWAARITFSPPSGVRPVALLAEPGSIPTAQGLGYCAGGPNYTCDWLLGYGHALWHGARYTFQLRTHSPLETEATSANGGGGEACWRLQVTWSGYSDLGGVHTARLGC